MSERVRVTATNGLNLRDSPRDGLVLQIIPNQTEVEVLGRETWLRVNCGGVTGFVSADYVEPEVATPDPPNSAAQIITLQHPALVGESLRVDADFAPSVRKLANQAAALHLAIFVTSSFREPNKPIEDAIVNPVMFSNHHVGHALDMNLEFQGKLFGSTDFADLNSLPADIKTFLNQSIAAAGLKWGGEFRPVPDVVHIDDRLNENNSNLFKLKFASLWGS
jgi:hypothetical protein